jgi:hypothetical protein
MPTVPLLASTASAGSQRRNSFLNLAPISRDAWDVDGSDAAGERRILALLQGSALPGNGIVQGQDDLLCTCHPARRIAPFHSVRFDQQDNLRIRSEREEQNRPVGTLGIRRRVAIDWLWEQPQFTLLVVNDFVGRETLRGLSNLDQPSLRRCFRGGGFGKGLELKQRPGRLHALRRHPARGCQMRISPLPGTEVSPE